MSKVDPKVSAVMKAMRAKVKNPGTAFKNNPEHARLMALKSWATRRAKKQQEQDQ